MSDPSDASDAGLPESQWPSDWLRAALGLAALKALSAGPSYGYAMIGELADAGLGQVKGGTLYPLLNRFEKAGLIATEWGPGDGGPGRKYFSLTAAGRSFLKEQSRDWALFAATVTDYLAPEGTLQP